MLFIKGRRLGDWILFIIGLFYCILAVNVMIFKIALPAYFSDMLTLLAIGLAMVFYVWSKSSIKG